MDKAAERTLERIIPAAEELFSKSKQKYFPVFEERLRRHFPQLVENMHYLYRNEYDFFYFLEKLVLTAAQKWIDRPVKFKKQDELRENDTGWYTDSSMMGMMCYVDLFAGDLEGIEEKIPYLNELGINYLHLMPLFKVPEEENDGGYAVSSYRGVNPRLGTMKQLKKLAARLKEEGICLVLDFINNHTSDEHIWAQKAKKGDSFYQDYYYLFPDRTLPDAYSKTLREIFPEIRRGNFTYDDETGKWVWTTFNNFQWDLNYSNPEVLISIAGEMLFLANQGVDILRLDAVPFTWKKLGTTCENLPQAHAIIKVLNAITRIAAPSMLFKSEAIVHPDEVEKYIATDECQLSYNPTLMALLWESLATREVKLLKYTLEHRFNLPEHCAWINYVRSHDDIGWSFADEDAHQLGIQPYDHRQFLNQFYTGQFDGSFAKGLPFQFNPDTGDLRISGTTASLAGIEKAMEEKDEEELTRAINRVLLLYSVVISAGGIPLIYMGDEIATLNDYEYVNHPAHKTDSRWAHRPETDWQKAARRNKKGTVEQRVFGGLKHMIDIRKKTPAFGQNTMLVLDSRNTHVLAYIKEKSFNRVLVLANFSEFEQEIYPEVLGVSGKGLTFRELITDKNINAETKVTLSGYQTMWLLLG